MRIRLRSAQHPSVATVLIGQNGLYLDGLTSILEENGYLVVDSIGSIAEFDPSLEPELILLSEWGWDESPREVIPRLRGLAPRARIAILAEPSDATTLREWLAMGVRACLDVLTQPEALVKSLNVVMQGNIVMPMGVVPHLGRSCVASPSHRPPAAPDAPRGLAANETLTDREVEILAYLAAGLSNKLIARRLSIAEATVKIHVKSILRKTGLQNRTQAAIWTHRHGIAPARLDAALD
ncbi:LuxR C-terminal-related transcriptional regulator [Methylobacterium sp. ID0610]|uniref:LuxR C-terminal-related transcriptional regulator n=1 Tax=Methylobacterium carpenticola TaxID=3344827 RepID=UPI003697A422